ncbi:hypothetical protein IGB42_03777 [Andreprevotia sp. IGB-42]|nr:hypothetical protein IGB42_03777 [Andreprevotia sp. IGB-42]
MLGEIQVRSALGERFQASVSVAGADDESLASNCFRLVTPQQLGDDAPPVLRRARLVYQPEDEHSGRLMIYGEDKVDEPLMSVAVRAKCPDEDRRVFQRDYSILLDPREYTAPPQAEARAALRSEPAARRSMPPLGGIWLSREGDRVDQISKAYFPRDKGSRARFVDALYLLNPDLPQSLQARLQADIQIRLPDRMSVLPERRDEVAAAPVEPQHMPAQPAPLPPLRIEASPIDAAQQPRQAARDENRIAAGDGGFQLRLSAPTLDTSRKSDMSPEESLRVREHLLALSSDDQTAQLLQLKYQISELEKQLSAVKSRTPDAEGGVSQPQAGKPAQPADGPAWWWALAPFVLIGGAAAWLYRRWRLRREYEEAESFSFATNLGAQPVVRSAIPQPGFVPNTSLGMRELVQNIAQAATDFHNDEVDVVQPNNVSEEAQLLIDHGLIQQAINLLDHELGQHPTALALWMKLFDVHCQQGMKQAFQERAVAFRLQFASDALWQQVQALGRQLDPDNPLYRSLDDQPDELLELSNAPPVMTSSPERDALDFASMMHEQAGLAPPSNVGGTLPQQAPVAPVRVEEVREPAPIPIPIPIPAPAAAPVHHQDISTGHESILPRLSFDVDESDALVFTPATGMVVSEVADIDPKQFVSDDPLLQQIAQHLSDNDLDTAFHLLEETLYHGTLDQRMTAMKWLDKLAPSRGL